ncbi:MAG: bifunctional UDP-2,4-diacetamido-2,4,6-trideoxy-beta-L-altropyranose hydrolase/GNAT family N-acetyltransferase [Bacteroidota bacterium]
MKKVFIITGGNNKTGYGHLVRCASLASILSEHYQCIFLLLDTPWDSIDATYQKEYLESPEDVIPYLQANSNKHDFVVIDTYSIDKNHVAEFRQLQLKTISINDLPEFGLPTDLLFNHAINVQPQVYDLPTRTELCLGKKYLLLRQAFFTANQLVPNQTPKPQILICFGGADPYGLSVKMLRFLSPYRNDYQFVIMTSSSPLMEALNQFKKENPDFDIQILTGLDAPSVAQLIVNATLAIVPASTISLECMCVGVRLITGYYVDNQEILSKSITELDLAVNVGDFNALDETTFQTHFQKAFEVDYQAKQNAFFDENPTKNITKEFKKLEYRDVEIKLQAVTFDDWQLLLDWRNDIETRKHSHTVDIISAKDHQMWLRNVLNDPQRQLFIAIMDEMPVGTVRADFDDTCAAYELSWTISPDARGKGVGKKMVKLMVEKLNDRVRAEIKDDNIPSIKIAEFAELKFFKKEDQVLHFTNY